MPSGPGTFQSVIDYTVQVLDTEDITAYLEGMICFHPRFEQHLHLEEINVPNGQEVRVQTVNFNFLPGPLSSSRVRALPQKP